MKVHPLKGSNKYWFVLFIFFRQKILLNCCFSIQIVTLECISFFIQKLEIFFFVIHELFNNFLFSIETNNRNFSWILEFFKEVSFFI